jgi:hypothetical protein
MIGKFVCYFSLEFVNTYIHVTPRGIAGEISFFYTRVAIAIVVAVLPSVHLFACISAAPTGQIFVKFVVVSFFFFFNLSRNSKFGLNGA